MGIETKETRGVGVQFIEPEKGLDKSSPYEDERYYLPCPLRKNQARIAVTICDQNKCEFMIKEEKKIRCNFGGKPIFRNRCGGLKSK
jgi:hypothetical protein